MVLGPYIWRVESSIAALPVFAPLPLIGFLAVFGSGNPVLLLGKFGSLRT